MPRFDPTIYGVRRVTITHRSKEPDGSSCINGSLEVTIEGEGDNDEPIRLTLHDTQHTLDTYRRDGIEVHLGPGIIPTQMKE